MIFSDLHMHTRYCDGKDCPEDMVLSAIDKGLKQVGVCVHSFITGATYCVKSENEDKFKAEMRALKEKYKGKIDVLCGIEQDAFSDYPASGYDYIIGSVHYFSAGGNFYDVDRSPEYFEYAVNKGFNGDYYAAAENYFSTLSGVVEKTGADIIGHFDLISKFNHGNRFFDESNPRYVNAWKSAADKLIPYGKPFEINLGGMSRGYKKTPYPSLEQIEYIKGMGGKFVFSSDAHKCENVAYLYKEWFERLKHIFK